MLYCLYLPLLNKFCIVFYYSDKAHLVGLANFSTDGQLDISSRTLVLNKLFCYLCIPLRERILSGLAIKIFLLCFCKVYFCCKMTLTLRISALEKRYTTIYFVDCLKVVLCTNQTALVFVFVILDSRPFCFEPSSSVTRAGILLERFWLCKTATC